LSVHPLTKEPQAQPMPPSEVKSEPEPAAPPLPFWGLISRNAQQFLSDRIRPMLRGVTALRTIAAGLLLAATALVAAPLAVAAAILGTAGMTLAVLLMAVLIVLVVIVEAGLNAANRIVKGKEH